MNARVLVVDDDADLLAPIRYALEREGFIVEIALDGEQGIEQARQDPFDVVVLDVMLPRLSGLDVCRELRAESDVPIVMLTARDDEVDRVLGLELGADDYVTKPFSTAELVSRIRAILRRRRLDREAARAALEVGGLCMDVQRQRVTVDGLDVELTPSESQLLLLLLENAQRVVTREEIMEHLWQGAYKGDPRASDVHISNLRRKIERDPSRPERLLTVRGLGYKLVAA